MVSSVAKYAHAALRQSPLKVRMLNKGAVSLWYCASAINTE